MKKAFTKFIDSILSDFKWYRKRKGGKWFKIYDTDGAGGFGGAVTYWTQEEGFEDIIKEENY